MGLPNLRSVDQLKVDLANKLYQCAIHLLQVCMVLGCLVSIENPARSWSWALLAMFVKATHQPDFISWFANLESFFLTRVHMAVSETNEPSCLQHMACLQSWRPAVLKNHVHASWQPFRTEQGIAFPPAAEAEYPSLLCDRMANCVLQMAKKLGVIPQIPPRLKDLLKLNMGQQTVRHLPLIPEYKTFVHSESPLSDSAYKLLAAPLQQGAESTKQHENQETPCKRSRKTFKYNVWHGPEEFLQKATGVRHPMDHDSVLHSITTEAIDKVVNTYPQNWQRKG